MVSQSVGLLASVTCRAARWSVDSLHACAAQAVMRLEDYERRPSAYLSALLSFLGSKKGDAGVSRAPTSVCFGNSTWYTNVGKTKSTKY